MMSEPCERSRVEILFCPEKKEKMGGDEKAWIGLRSWFESIY